MIAFKFDYSRDNGERRRECLHKQPRHPATFACQHQSREVARTFDVVQTGGVTRALCGGERARRRCAPGRKRKGGAARRRAKGQPCDSRERHGACRGNGYLPTDGRLLLFRRGLIRILLPLTWRPFAKFRAARLARFGVTELDSAWQILHALDALDDPGTRCRVLQHALEEMHHASEFARVSRLPHPSVPPTPTPERHAIFRREQGTQGLIAYAAYACVGEEDVLAQFDAYASGVGDKDAEQVFREARLDEHGHVGLCRGLLVGLVGESGARRELTLARLRRLWEAWTRLGRDLGDVGSVVFFGSLYLVLGSFAFVPGWHRLHSRG